MTCAPLEKLPTFADGSTLVDGIITFSSERCSGSVKWSGRYCVRNCGWSCNWLKSWSRFVRRRILAAFRIRRWGVCFVLLIVREVKMGVEFSSLLSYCIVWNVNKEDHEMREEVIWQSNDQNVTFKAVYKPYSIWCSLWQTSQLIQNFGISECSLDCFRFTKVALVVFT